MYIWLFSLSLSLLPLGLSVECGALVLRERVLNYTSFPTAQTRRIGRDFEDPIFLCFCESTQTLDGISGATLNVFKIPVVCRKLGCEQKEQFTLTVTRDELDAEWEDKQEQSVCQWVEAAAEVILENAESALIGTATFWCSGSLGKPFDAFRRNIPEPFGFNGLSRIFVPQEIYTRTIMEEKACRRPRSSTHPRPCLHPAQTNKENDEALEAPAGALLSATLDRRRRRRVTRRDLTHLRPSALLPIESTLRSPKQYGYRTLRPEQAPACRRNGRRERRPITTRANNQPHNTTQDCARILSRTYKHTSALLRWPAEASPLPTDADADAVAVDPQTPRSQDLAVDTGPELAGPIALTSLRDTAREQSRVRTDFQIRAARGGLSHSGWLVHPDRAIHSPSLSLSCYWNDFYPTNYRSADNHRPGKLYGALAYKRGDRYSPRLFNHLVSFVVYRFIWAIHLVFYFISPHFESISECLSTQHRCAYVDRNIREFMMASLLLHEHCTGPFYIASTTVLETQVDSLTNACGSEQSPARDTAPMAKNRGRFESQRVATPYAKDDEEEMKKRQNLRKNKKVYLNVRLQEAEASLKDHGEDETKKRGIQKKNKKVGLNVRLQAVQMELQQGSQPPSPEER
ncbi:hypothetical protein C8J57DRAFT_1599888 [Mycena rebaudengoi]|nr:hypothetical protein C8J57DRAFT_1599888 [Mycena rebaudengoi]